MKHHKQLQHHVETAMESKTCNDSESDGENIVFEEYESERYFIVSVNNMCFNYI